MSHDWEGNHLITEQSLERPHLKIERLVYLTITGRHVWLFLADWKMETQRKTQRGLHSHEQKRHSCLQCAKSSSFFIHASSHILLDHTQQQQQMVSNSNYTHVSEHNPTGRPGDPQINLRRLWSKQLFKVCLLQRKENVRSSRLCQQACLISIRPCVSKCTWTNTQSKYCTQAINIRNNPLTSPPRKAREDEAAGNCRWAGLRCRTCCCGCCAAAQTPAAQSRRVQIQYSWVLLATGRFHFLLTCYRLEGKYYTQALLHTKQYTTGFHFILFLFRCVW